MNPNNTVTVIPKGGENILINPERVTMIVYQPIDPNNIGQRVVSILAEGPIILNMPADKFEATDFYRHGHVDAFVTISPNP